MNGSTPKTRRCAPASVQSSSRRTSSRSWSRRRSEPHPGRFTMSPGLTREALHHPIERRLSFEADARAVGQRDVSVFDHGVVGKAREYTEHARIALRAAEAKPGRDGKRHLVAAMREIA